MRIPFGKIGVHLTGNIREDDRGITTLGPETESYYPTSNPEN